jgi:eukaryotic-like serine/threonine-protein kinase
MNEPPNPEVAVFAAALELPADKRGAYLDQACSVDAALRRQVEALLRVHDDAGDFFDKLASVAQPTAVEGVMHGSSGTIRLPSIPSEKPGDRIGRYKLLQQIGEGGCGVVYMAEQEEPVRRRVALKVIKLGMDTKSVVARFEAERQALALMDHPNIAKVLEAGATDTGRPYFVMELVRGIKITDYCDENNLSTSARLELFIQVCQAIQHAHQKGIIHRDIKPSNILVADHDGTPVPKIIDFGIAKATTDQRLTDKTLFTAFEQFIGTPAYMSPEQAKLSGLDIDTRSDIYSLGVLLYELLAGSTPFDAKELMSSGLDAMRKIIREQEPVRPSTRFATLQAADLTTTAKRRSTDTSKLLHQLRGDLDWIVMKCLEKDRTRRYETANGLAMDIQRHLQNELVLARPPSVGYKFQRLVRRNKLAFTALVAVTAALIIGLGVATWSFFIEQRALRQAEAERKKAKTEAAKATAISDFFQQSLQAANPDESKSSDYTVRQLLDDYSAGLKGQFTNQPEVEAAVRETIGKAYYRLGAGDIAQPHLERALVLNRQLYGEHEQVAATLADCAWASFEQGQLANAESQARAALDIYRKSGAVGQPVIFALWILQLTLNSQERYAEAETVTELALTIARKTPNIEFPETASIIHGLAQAKVQQAKYAEAEDLFWRAVEMHRRLQGSQHPETGWALVGLASSLRLQHKLDDAERAAREALAIFKREWSYGGKSAAAIGELKAVLEAKGDFAGQVALYENLLAAQRSALGNDNPTVADTLASLAGALQAQGKPIEAEKASSEALGITHKLNGPDLARLPSLVSQLAQLLNTRGKADEAEKLFEDNINIARQKLGGTNLILGDLFYDFGDFLNHEGKMRPALDQYLNSLSIRRARPDDNLSMTLRLVGDTLNRMGRYQEAEGHLREAVTLYRRLHQQEDLGATGWANEKLGDALRQQHKLPEAEQAYRDDLSAYIKLGAVGNDGFANQVRLLQDVLLAENKPVEIEELYQQVLAAQRSALGSDSPTVVATLFVLADFLKSQNRLEEAAQKFREAVGGIFKTHGEDPLKVPPSVQQLAQKLVDQGQLADAEQLYNDAIKIARQNLGTAHPALGILYYDFSNLLRNETKLDAAEEQCRNALQIQNATKDEALAATLRAMGWIQLHTGKPQEAEQSLREVLEIYRALPKREDYRRTAYPSMNLGIALFDQHKLPEAEQALREAVALITQHRATDEDIYTYSACWLVMALKEDNKPTESESLLHDVSFLEGQATVAAGLIENAASLPKAIWPGEAANWSRYGSEILEKATAEELVKLPSTVFPKLVEMGNKQLVTDICRVMLNSTSTNGAWFNSASWCLATTENPTNRDPAMAVELAKRAVEINPQGDWNTVGVAYYRAADFNQALDYLRRSEQRANGDASSFDTFFLAMAERQVGHADAARRYYVHAIQWMNAHDPQNPELLRFRAEAERLLGPEASTGAETQIPVPPAAK